MSRALNPIRAALWRTCLMVWVVCQLGLTPAWAAGQAFVQLEPDTLTLGQTGRMTLLMVGGRPNAQPDLADPDGATLSFDSSYQQFRSDGYQRTLVFGFRYRITPTREGQVTVGPYTLKMADGSEVQTQPVTLQVLPGADSPSDTPPIRVTSGFGRTEAWEGQVLLYSLEMTARVPVLGLNWRLGDFPSLTKPSGIDNDAKEFIVEEGDERITVNRLVIPYVATGVGPLPKKAPVASVNVGTGRRGIFGLQQYQTEAVAGNPVDLTVRALPPAPANFSGLIGDVQFRSRLDRASASVGSSIKWTLEVVGDANLDGWKPPQIGETLPVAVYEGDSTVESQIQQGRYIALGRVERVVVPTEPGTLDLGRLELVTFSPSRGEYVTHRVDVGTLQVGGGEEVLAEVQSFAPTVSTVLADEGPGFRDNHSWGLASRLPVRTPLLAASVVSAVPALVLGWLSVLGRVRQRLEARAESRRRPPTPTERLAQLPDAPGARLAALDMVLRQALAEWAGVEPGVLDREAVLEVLPDAVADRVRAVTQQLDRARFAGGSADGSESEVRALVSELGAL